MQISTRAPIAAYGVSRKVGAEQRLRMSSATTPIQGRGHPPSWSVAPLRGCRIRNPRMGLTGSITAACWSTSRTSRPPNRRRTSTRP